MKFISPSDLEKLKSMSTVEERKAYIDSIPDTDLQHDDKDVSRSEIDSFLETVFDKDLNWTDEDEAKWNELEAKRLEEERKETVAKRLEKNQDFINQLELPEL